MLYCSLTEFVSMHYEKTIRQNSHGVNFVVQPLEEKQNTSKKLLPDNFPINMM